jgi:hypothetical protein
MLRTDITIAYFYFVKKTCGLLSLSTNNSLKTSEARKSKQLKSDTKLIMAPSRDNNGEKIIMSGCDDATNAYIFVLEKQIEHTIMKRYLIE